MTHNRVFIKKQALSIGEICELSPEEAHHLIHVKRCRPGDSIELCCESGHVYKGIIRKTVFSVQVEVTARLNRDHNQVSIDLYFGMTKWKAIESAVSKCAELGCMRFIPVIAQRSIIRSMTHSRAERLKKLIREAVKQSLQRTVMELDLSLPDLTHVIRSTNWAEYDKIFLFLPSAKKKFQGGSLSDNEKKIAVFIGPEGDFSPEEVHLFTEKGIDACTLGEFTLRSDTAAIAVLSAIILGG